MYVEEKLTLHNIFMPGVHLTFISNFVQVIQTIYYKFLFLLPPPHRVMFLPGFVCPSVYLFVCSKQDSSKTYGQSSVKVSGYVRNDKRNK